MQMYLFFDMFAWPSSYHGMPDITDILEEKTVFLQHQPVKLILLYE